MDISLNQLRFAFDNTKMLDEMTAEAYKVGVPALQEVISAAKRGNERQVVEAIYSLEKWCCVWLDVLEDNKQVEEQ